MNECVWRCDFFDEQMTFESVQVLASKSQYHKTRNHYKSLQVTGGQAPTSPKDKDGAKKPMKKKKTSIKPSENVKGVRLTAIDSSYPSQSCTRITYCHGHQCHHDTRVPSCSENPSWNSVVCFCLRTLLTRGRICHELVG